MKSSSGHLAYQSPGLLWPCCAGRRSYSPMIQITGMVHILKAQEKAEEHALYVQANGMTPSSSACCKRAPRRYFSYQKADVDSLKVHRELDTQPPIEVPIALDSRKRPDDRDTFFESLCNSVCASRSADSNRASLSHSVLFDAVCLQNPTASKTLGRIDGYTV